MKEPVKLVGLVGVIACCCTGILVPKPDLAQALRASDTVIVARVISGQAQSNDAGASAHLVLRVVRVLKGEIAVGSELAIETRGSRLYTPGPSSRMPRQWSVDHFTALWFLRREGNQYSVIPVTAAAGEPERASLELPEDASVPDEPQDLQLAIAREIVATLRVMAVSHPKEIAPVYHVQLINGQVDRSYSVGPYAAKALQLNEALGTLGDAATLLPVYRELAAEPAGYLRGIGIAGLIAANDPAGPKQAAAEIRTLFHEAYVSPIGMSLWRYHNLSDPAAIVAIGRLATESADLDMLELQRSAARSLYNLHSRQALPALVALLDSSDPEVGGLALSGLCMFTRNAPLLNVNLNPSDFAWMKSIEPAPFRTKETDAYCWMTPAPATQVPPDRKAFWKQWWQDHEVELMR